jgi:hypothetical protein
MLGPGQLGTRAWPITAHVFPPVALGNPLAVNNDVPSTGESYEYTVENQFVEVTNKWDSKGTYFYFHPLPVGRSPVTRSMEECRSRLKSLMTISSSGSTPKVRNRVADIVLCRGSRWIFSFPPDTQTEVIARRIRQVLPDPQISLRGEN